MERTSCHWLLQAHSQSRMQLIPSARHHQDPQGLEHPTCSRHNNTTSMAENNVQGDAATQERGQGPREEARQQQTQAKQQRTRQTSGQRERGQTPVNQETILRMEEATDISSSAPEVSCTGRASKPPFHRRLHRHICPRRLGPRGTTEKKQQNRMGNDRQSHRSNTPSTCEIGMNFFLTCTKCRRSDTQARSECRSINHELEPQMANGPPASHS